MNLSLQVSIYKIKVTIVYDVCQYFTEWGEVMDKMLPPAQDKGKGYSKGEISLYRSVIFILGSIAIISLLGTIYLVAMKATSIPDGIIALGSAAVGALAGILATPGNSNLGDNNQGDNNQ